MDEHRVDIQWATGTTGSVRIKQNNYSMLLAIHGGALRYYRPHRAGSLKGRRTRGAASESNEPLENDTFVLLRLAASKERSTSCVLEDLTDALARPGGALEVVFGADLLRNGHALLRSDGPLRRLPELVNHSWITAQIFLACDKDNRQARAEVHDLRDPLFLDVVQRVRGVDSEANKNDMGIRVREWPKAVIVFLASSIPEGEFDVLPVDLDIRNVVLEYSRYVDLGEGAFGEHN